MRKRRFAATTIAALLTLYLGVPCLALARSHGTMAMGAMDDEPGLPCEAGEAPIDQLMCATPDAYAPLVAGVADVQPVALEPVPVATATIVVHYPLQSHHVLAPRGSPPAFLLHRAFLI
jgi:hypothetical protein